MKMKQCIRLLLVFLLCSGNSIKLSAKTEVTHLICEYQKNPIGIDVKNPRLSWQIQSDRENVLQTAYEIRAAESPAMLKRRDDLIWTSGKVESNQSLDVVYKGPILASMQRVYWEVRIWDNRGKVTRWSEPAYWEVGLLKPTDWKASWITSSVAEDSPVSEPCPYFRKEFSLTKKVKSARIYVTSKGLYQLFLNGKKVSPDLFAPGWTSYNKRLQYQTYDVTSLLEKKNAVGTILGDGWYRGYLTWDRKRNTYGDKLAVILQLQINYVDGTSEIVTTDNTWKEKTGPILSSDIYDGETFDARLKMPGWDKPDFDDSQWNKVSELPDGKDILVAQDGVPVRATDEIKPIKLFTTPKGETVFDLGQNMVGWVRLKVRGSKGDKVVLKFAEVLDKDGNFYTANLRKAKATDTYILSGKGVEVYEPHFTFHGFRFVKVEGFPGTPDLNSITGIVIHSDMKLTGNFVCSDSLLNQLQHNIQWGQRGNFLDVPTDCPQRDERLGWTGDAQVFSMTAAFNFNVAAFYTKWLRDLAADQQSNGIVPHVIPDVLHGAGGSTAWADASVIVPWSVYLTYGDKRILEEQYPSMKAWVEYMHGRAGNKNLWLGDAHFGDWLAFATTRSDYPGATTDKDLIATAYYFYSTSLLSKIAGVIGKESDAEHYKKLAGEIKNAFNAEFVTPNGRLESNTQTAYVLALAFHLLPEDRVSKAVNYLADDVKKFGHLTTGFVGTPLLCRTLSDNGYPDLAFMLLMNKKYPSWLYPVTQGATTIWERWDGQKPDGTFQDVGMNSFNHYAYGAIGEWMYSYVGGIRIAPKEPGYKHFFLSPHVGGGLSYVTTNYQSLYGPIESDWKIRNGHFVYTVTIPTNTMATVILPKAKSEQLMMNSLPLKSEMRKVVTQQPGGVCMELGSGHYQFSYPYEEAKEEKK